MSIFNNSEFVDIDLELRHGGHINRSNITAYDYMTKNFDDLQAFYSQYGCQLQQHQDGFFYMLVKGGRFKTSLLPKSCVHLGIFIALKARDPEITQSSGRIGITQLLQDIETSVPRETLQRIYAPKRRDSTVYESITDEILKALKIIAELGFVELIETYLRPLEAINRFSEVARLTSENGEENSDRLISRHGVVIDEQGAELEEGHEDD